MISLDNLKTVINAIKCLLTDYPKKKDIPTKLPNPNALNFTGAVTRSYDGSEALTVEISSATKPLTYDYMPEGYPSKAVQTTTLMEEQELAFKVSPAGAYTSAISIHSPKIVVGQTYTVKWDGAEYECVGFKFDVNTSAIGNPSILGKGDDTGEPFLYTYNIRRGRGTFGTHDTSASHTISVKTTAEVITPMVEEFLPTGVTAAAIDNAQTTADTAQTTADNAQATAEAAQTAANDAKTAANDAKTAANDAKTTANAAQTTANAAKTTADNAKTTANNAKTLANAAATKENPVFTGSFSQNRKVSSVKGDYSHAEGYDCAASGNNSHAEGVNTTASGNNSHAEGSYTTASGYCSHAEGGLGTTASGSYSHAEGQSTTASGGCSHAEGYNTKAFYSGSNTTEIVANHAEGDSTTASGACSHSEGQHTTASGACSHSEGQHTTASGSYSHAEGYNTTASGESSHAEGYNTTASGSYSHAEGFKTTASGAGSHAEGNGTKASGICSHVEGNFNIEDSLSTYIHIAGNGESADKPSNAYTLDWDGNAWFAGTVEGTALVIPSSTTGSTKKFKITVDDSGTLTATEVV